MFKRCYRQVKSADFILPAPIGGLNKRDPISAMDATDAVEMDNYIPMTSSIELRPGYELYAKLSDFHNGQKIETLARYSTSETERMIAVFAGKAYDVSTSTPVCFDQVVFSKSRCQTMLYQNRLFLMNGVDVPKVFYVDEQNQSHLQDWGFQGEDLSSPKIVNGSVSHEFVWFVEKNSTRAWVSNVAGNISGTLEAFDVAQVLKWGGHLITVFNWTIDGGTGLDDYTCLMSSEGEVLVYKGYNPHDAGHFELKGSYKLSKPIGYQCVMPFLGDVVVMTEDGYMPLSKVLSSNNAVIASFAFSDKIRGLVLKRASVYKYLEGWQSIVYAKKGYAIFNVPVGNTFEQHVININTGAWCRFTNIRAFCWCSFQDHIYFGSDNAIYRFGEVYADDGQPIEGAVEQAYSSLGSDHLKKIVLIKPRICSSKDFRLTVYTNMDYEKNNAGYYVDVGQEIMTKWNASKWNEGKWLSYKTRKMQGQWIENSATGFKASVVFKTKTKATLIEWYETGLRLQRGTGIL